MKCFRCLKTPDQIPEYAEIAAEEGMSPEDYVRSEEGTFNPETQTFACTSCYIAIGMPSAPWPGWKAPEA